MCGKGVGEIIQGRILELRETLHRERLRSEQPVIEEIVPVAPFREEDPGVMRPVDHVPEHEVLEVWREVEVLARGIRRGRPELDPEIMEGVALPSIVTRNQTKRVRRINVTTRP